jgi:hypothetical protein
MMQVRRKMTQSVLGMGKHWTVNPGAYLDALTDRTTSDRYCQKIEALAQTLIAKTDD